MALSVLNTQERAKLRHYHHVDISYGEWNKYCLSMQKLKN